MGLDMELFSPELKPGRSAGMKKRQRHLPAGIASYLCVAHSVFGTPLAFAADAVPAATGGGTNTALLAAAVLGAAALAGAALGAGLSWFFLRKKTANTGLPLESTGPASNRSGLNAANNLTSGFIHEFNNSLCTIQGFTDLALLRSSGQTAERQGLEQIRIGVQRSTRLLEQLGRFHVEVETAQPVPLGLLLKGYDKWVRSLQSGPVGTNGSGQKSDQQNMPVRLNVQVRDTSTMVLAQPVQVQHLLGLLHQAAITAAEDGGGREVQLVLRQAVIDRVDGQNPRLELVLNGIAELPAASTQALEQVATELGGSFLIHKEKDGAKSCRLSLPGQPAAVPPY